MLAAGAQNKAKKESTGSMVAMEYFLATRMKTFDMPSYNKLVTMFMNVTMFTTSLFTFTMFFGFVMGFVIYPRAFETCINYTVTDVAVRKQLFLALGVLLSLFGTLALGLCLYYGVKVIIAKVSMRKKVTMSKWTTGKSTCLIVMTVVVTTLLLLMVIFFTSINAFIKSQSAEAVTVNLELLVTECCAMVLFTVLFVCMICLCCLASNTKTNPMFDALGPVIKTGKGDDAYKLDESQPFMSTFYSES